MKQPDVKSKAGLSRWGGWRIRENSRQQVCDYDSYHLTAKEWLLYGAEGIGFCALVSYVFYRSILVFGLLLPVGMAYPLWKRKELKAQRLEALYIQFKDAIMVLSSFLGAGYSVENAFAASVKELEVLSGPDGMMVMEISRMASLLKMNRPVELVMMEFADRCGLDDVRNFAEVFGAAKRSGGELVSIIGQTAGVIRDKVQLREEMKTLTASRRFEQKLMNMIPFFIVIYIDITSAGFFQIMYSTLLGRVLMTACLGVYVLSWILADRILNIEV